MSTPKWFRLSDVSAPLQEVYRETEKLRAAHRFEPTQIARLDWDEDSGTLDFQEDSVRDLQKGEEPLAVAEPWEGFAVSYFVRSIQVSLYLHFWRLEAGTGLGVGIDDQVPYVEPPGMAEGEWLERFLCDYVAACGSSGCDNQWARRFSLDPFDMTSMVEAWREKGLPPEPHRGFTMFSEDIVSASEMRTWDLNRSEGDREWFRYFRVPGYHVFSTLSQRSWWEK
ncbi:hypothetical protein [Pyxidicoccus xibeiensis]|uniref:hypothetical protein n=1 Tax=Pyxidicoccus xibeiensis TaxID=2906759 RepID=UPI0020A75421|nr:hypothetical protein [Pyxidicoccus xibeiensis]MCP3141894.1 hypothetical protein [Pyxidicoccus xibeiensis]